MIKSLNHRYDTSGRESMANTLIPAWYEVEHENLKQELAKPVQYTSLTSDGWTSIAQDHYITVTIHYIKYGKLHQKVLQTKAVYLSQTGEVVAEEIGDCIEEYNIQQKVVACTVDNASNMTVAINRLDILKVGCFAHTLNLGAQKIYTDTTIMTWVRRIRNTVVWFKRVTLGKVVLREKQDLLGIKEHSLVLDVKTRWNTILSF